MLEVKRPYDEWLTKVIVFNDNEHIAIYNPRHMSWMILKVDTKCVLDCLTLDNLNTLNIK